MCAVFPSDFDADPIKTINYVKYFINHTADSHIFSIFAPSLIVNGLETKFIGLWIYRLLFMQIDLPLIIANGCLSGLLPCLLVLTLLLIRLSLILSFFMVTHVLLNLFVNSMIGKFNPLNIRYSYRNHWKGQTGENKGFCNFSSYVFGIRAAAYLLMHSYRKAGCRTYSQLITRFAPPSENPTQKYIDTVCGWLHVFPWDIPDSPKRFAGLIHKMWRFEQGCFPEWSADSILTVINNQGIRIYGK